MNNLLRRVLLVEYTVIDNLGRPKNWRMYGPITDLRDMEKVRASITQRHPNRKFKTRVYEYSTATGSVQIA